MASRDPERRRRVEELCDAALDRDGPERAAFLASACAGDEALRREVQALLAHARTAEAFLAAPVGAIAADVLEEPHAVLPVGRRLGAYEILSLLGAGGMGEVYRARDGKLDRDVAMKILPRAFATDPERLARFEREARLLARLNHPHIGAIYGLEEAEGVRALVLELVEGDTLADRIARGPIPIKNALSVAQQIAEALHAAHQNGIIHRDLKPANVKVRPDGLVKVLDFGLAKAMARHAATPDLTHSPMTSVGGTREGLILGTAAYMSPEQARGEPVDKQADIWAFGCVLYEMLTGRAAFARETITDTLAAIIEREPEWDALPTATPPTIVRLLHRCLAKDPSRRLHDVADARIEIADADSDRVRTATATVSTGRRKAPVFASAGLLLCAFAAFGYFRFVREPATPPTAPRSIAVLPFKRLSPQADDEYLGVGVCDVLVTKLSSLHHLVVRPTSAVLKYEAAGTDTVAAGRELRTDAVLEGSLQRDGDRLRVTVRLVTVADGGTIWAETFDERFGDLFKVQDAIAGDVVRALAVRLGQDDRELLSKRYTRNTDAYQLYLKGRYFWGKPTDANTRKSIEYFERAIALDPGYALAYTGLADAYWTLHFLAQSADAEDLPSRAKAAALKALALDDTLAEARTSLGEIKEVYDLDFAAAESEYKRALALNPNYAFGHQRYGYLLNKMGRLDEAKAEFSRALALDPLSPLINTDAARPFIRSKDYPRAIEQLRVAVEIEPTFPRAHNLLAFCYMLMGRYDEAASEAQRAAELSEPSPVQGGAAQRISYQLAYIYASAGRAADARRVLEALEASHSARNDQLIFHAFTYAALGDRDRAFFFIEKMYETRNLDFAALKSDPPTPDSVRNDARVQALLRRSGLVP